MSDPRVTVVIPAIPPRFEYLGRAMKSVYAQSHPVESVAVAVDHDRRGAAVTRQRALDMVRTEWLAFLDDDDELLPEHIAMCMKYALYTDADLVYPWFNVVGGSDPFPMHFGKEWRNDHPIQFPITYLAKTEAIRHAGGFVTVEDGEYHDDGNRAGEDWRLELALVATGAKIVHLPERTWNWYHHGANTSGLPDRW